MFLKFYLYTIVYIILFDRLKLLNNIIQKFIFRELNDPKITSVVQGNGQNVTVKCELAHHTFMYDHCFVSYNDPFITGHASQEVVFHNMVLPLVQNAFEGYNVCLFAYGQTGSGKSYSLMGTEPAQLSTMSLDEKVGIIPRFCQEIFTQARNNPQIETTIEISYFEIYNEKIHDLLANMNNGSKKAPLKVREHPVFGPYVVDLSQHCVQNYKDLQVPRLVRIKLRLFNRCFTDVNILDLA